MTEITIKGDFSIEDKTARQIINQMWTKIETLNERTKNHTIEIRDLRKKIKEKGK